MENQPDKTEDSNLDDLAIRIERNELRRLLNSIYHNQAASMRRLRYLGGAVGFNFSMIWLPEMSTWPEGSFIASAVVLGATALGATPFEISRRRYEALAQATAQEAIEEATTEPAIAVPNWAEKELSQEG